MIGTWMLDECYSYKLLSSHNPGDAPSNSLKRTMHFQGGSAVDYITRTHILSTCTVRPLVYGLYMMTHMSLYDLCMSTDAVLRVGKILCCLQKQKAIIYEIKTDSCLYKLPNRATEVLKDTAFRDLMPREKFEPKRCLDELYAPYIRI